MLRTATAGARGETLAGRVADDGAAGGAGATARVGGGGGAGAGGGGGGGGPPGGGGGPGARRGRGGAGGRVDREQRALRGCALSLEARELLLGHGALRLERRQLLLLVLARGARLLGGGLQPGQLGGGAVARRHQRGHLRLATI